MFLAYSLFCIVLIAGFLPAQGDQVADVTLDSFSTKVISLCNVNLQENVNYVVKDDNTLTIDISTLGQDDISFGLLDLFEGNTFQYYDFRQIIFKNAKETQTLTFQGITGIMEENQGGITHNPELGYLSWLLSFNNIKNLNFGKIEFKNDFFIKVGLLSITNCFNVQFDTMSFNQIQDTLFIIIIQAITGTLKFDQISLVDNKQFVLTQIIDSVDIQFNGIIIDSTVFQSNVNMIHIINAGAIKLDKFQVLNHDKDNVKNTIGVKIEQAASLILRSAVIKSNIKHRNFQALRADAVLVIKIIEMDMQYNIGGIDFGSIMYLDSFIKGQSSITITDSYFNDNISPIVGGAFYLSSSTIEIVRCQFIHHRSYLQGGALFVEKVNIFTISDSLFERNESDSNGGAIALGSGSTEFSFYLNKVTFNNNIAKQGDAGAILINIGNVIQLDDCEFNDNFANLGNGGAIYAKSIKQFSLTNTKLTGNSANIGGAVAIDISNFIFIFGTTAFEDNNANQSGGAIYADSITNLIFFQSSSIKSNYAELGGGAYIGQNTSQILFDNSFIEKNEAVNGGGLYLNNKGLQLSSTIIQNNKATSSGGGIFCNTINYQVDLKSKIKGNSAQMGGGIYFLMINIPAQDKVSLEDITTDNTAVLYGNNLGQRVVKAEIQQIYEYDEGSQTYEDLIFAQIGEDDLNYEEDYIALELKSASMILILWRFVGKDYNYDIEPFDPMANNINEILDINYQQQSPLSQQTNYIEKRVIFNKDELLPSEEFFTTSIFIIGQPGQSFKADLTFFIGQQDISPVTKVIFRFRNCLVGEIYVHEVFNVCYQCPDGTYSFDSPTSQNATCLTKPDEVLISYSDIWFLKEGYWRSNQYSSEVISCPVDDSCLGGYGFGDFLCNNGYQDLLCQSCIFESSVKYSRNIFNNQCSECSSKQAEDIALLVILCLYTFIAFWLVITITVRDILRARISRTLVTMKALIMGRTQMQRGLLVVYFKTILHFLQVSFALWFFQVSQLNVSERMFVVPRYLGDTLATIVELCSCFFDPDSTLNSDSVVFTQLLVIEIVPVALFLTVTAILMIVRKFKKISWNDSMLYIYNLFWFTFCGFFSLSMLKALVFVTACTSIESQNSRMYADYNIDCESNDTRRILLFTFITPMFAAICAFLPLRLLQIFLDNRLYPNRRTNETTSRFISLELREDFRVSNFEADSFDQSDDQSSALSPDFNSRNTINSKNLSQRESKKVVFSNKHQEEVISLDDDEQEVQKKSNNDDDKEFKKSIRISLLRKSKPDRYRLTANTARELRFGYLLMGYRVCYWEVVRILVRETILIIMMFFNEIPSFGGSICIAVMLIYLFSLHRVRPFSTRQLNLLEEESTLISTICLFCFVIVGMIENDSQFDLLPDFLTIIVYFLFSWFMIKLIILILSSLFEDTKYGVYFQKLINLIVPGSFLIQGPNAVFHWKKLRVQLQKVVKLLKLKEKGLIKVTNKK